MNSVIYHGPLLVRIIIEYSQIIMSCNFNTLILAKPVKLIEDSNISHFIIENCLLVFCQILCQVN